MTAIQFQSLLQNAINQKVKLTVYENLYVYTCNSNSNGYFKTSIHNLNPLSFECMEAINSTVKLFNFGTTWSREIPCADKP